MTFKRIRARQVAADMGSCHCRRWCNLQKEATLGLMEPLHESIGRAAGVCSSPSSRGKLEVACAESLWRNGLATSVNDHGFAAQGHAITNLASSRRLIWNSRSWPKHIASRQSQGKLLLCSASFTFQSTCVTRTSFAIGNTSLKHPYRILHRIESTIGTDMGDQDRLALAWRNYHSSGALTSLTHRYIYLKGIWGLSSFLSRLYHIVP